MRIATVPHALTALAFALVWPGCFSAATSPYMRPSAEPLVRAPADKALVVFIRPSGYAGAIGTNVLDENGRFLGDSLAQSYFAVLLPPGHHEFIVWAENTDGLAADLAPGRTYFVEVQPTMGAFSAQMHLRAIKPSLANWAQRDAWLQKSHLLQSDFPAGQANLDKRGRDVAERTRRAHEHLSKYSGAALADHTLAPDDGVTI